MRSFPIPFDINTEEKIVGGYLTLKQTIYLVLTVVMVLIILFVPIGGGLAEMIAGKASSIAIIIKIIMCVAVSIIGVLFMFLKPHGMSFLKYLTVKIQYIDRNKNIIYRR
ncbi:MAG TPA: PrgI family protein [Clostridiales bacterium]|nr:PrgI family protein [Clostridiales bacterium]